MNSQMCHSKSVSSLFVNRAIVALSPNIDASNFSAIHSYNGSVFVVILYQVN